MFNSSTERIVPEIEEFKKIQALQASQKQIVGKPNTDVALEELKKTLNFIEIKSILDLPKSYVSTLRVNEKKVNCVSFSPDGRFLASGSGDKLIKIWNLAEKREECTIPVDPGLIETIKFSSDSELIIVKLESGSVNYLST
ncbi:hypothetical protein SteCoe_38861 [Stentor coeruleus]|uniref:Uncharacterized protein n=1 Tax=Stentor coeruleus TaxID=5963 RepID=A0A1R2AKY8_9CILI|nr:hypothetical protein SteCoe_38861 [Stentor coeruleus]